MTCITEGKHPMADSYQYDQEGYEELHHVLSCILLGIKSPGGGTMKSRCDIVDITNDLRASAIVTGLYQFQTCRRVTVGNGLTADIFREQFTGTISNWASYILNQIEFSSHEESLDLTFLSVADLGFPNGATYKEICDRAQELGLRLCPAEVGPQFRLQCIEQPEEGQLRIAMEQIQGSSGKPELFYLGCYGDGIWLDSTCGSPGNRWNSDIRFVFCK